MFAKHYAQYYDLFNNDKPYKKEIEFVYKWAEKPTSILDIGAGTANYWDFYPKEVGFKIGIEKSKDMIKKSKYKFFLFDFDLVGLKLWPTTVARNIEFDLATALFDVLNYIPTHDWWKFMPIKKGGYFIFDVFNKEKVDKEGFGWTENKCGNITRKIKPIQYDGKTVDLEIEVEDNGLVFKEQHRLYIHSQEDIEKFCGSEFEIVDTKSTKGSWQKFWKLRRK